MQNQSELVSDWGESGINVMYLKEINFKKVIKKPSYLTKETIHHGRIKTSQRQALVLAQPDDLAFLCFNFPPIKLG